MIDFLRTESTLERITARYKERRKELEDQIEHHQKKADYHQRQADHAEKMIFLCTGIIIGLSTSTILHDIFLYFGKH